MSTTFPGKLLDSPIQSYRVPAITGQVDILDAELAIRALSTRRSSTSPTSRNTLNVKLIQMPRAYIDYVVFHELCHLKEPNHSPAYYRPLDRALPDDWRERCARLNAFTSG